MILGEILALLSITKKFKMMLGDKTIQGDIVEIIDGELTKTYPYFNSKILINFFSKSDVIDIVEKIRNGEDYDSQLSDSLEFFLKSQSLTVEDPLQMLRTFIEEIEARIVAKSDAMSKLQYKYLKDISQKLDSKESHNDKDLKEIFEYLKKIDGKITTDPIPSKNQYFKEIILQWPNTWEEIPEDVKEKSKERVKVFLQENDFPELPPVFPVLSIRRTTNLPELMPTLNIIIHETEFTDIEKLCTATILPFLKVNYIITDHNIDLDENSFTLNIQIPKETISNVKLEEDIFQMQKTFLKGKKQHVVTLTKVYAKTLKKNPEIGEEISSILQSFAII